MSLFSACNLKLHSILYMRSMLKRWSSFAPLILVSVLTQSQAGTGMSNLFFYGIAALALILFFFLIVSVADNLMVIESRQTGAAKTGANFGLIPSFRELFGAKLPSFLDGKHVYSLKKGHDIPLEGAAVKEVNPNTTATRFAVQPGNFLGLRPIPKMVVEVGDSVKAGDPLFYDKQLDRIKFCAPVSGEVIAINRGAKRAISEVVILADREQVSRTYRLPTLDINRSELVDFLLGSGLWPFIRQRPYNVVADPDVTPRDIFVSTFDSGPLGPDMSYAVEGRAEAFQLGLNVLNRLTDGMVYLGLDGRGDAAPSAVFTDAQGVEKRYFRGKHPAGNVGVQIHHIHPVSAGDKVWTLDAHGVLAIGELFGTGRFDTSRFVALTGAPLNEAGYVRTYPGANLGELLRGRLDFTENLRLLSGNVLTGSEKTEDQFLDFFANQVTVLEEGNQAELFGWLFPLKARPVPN
ncbi:MAG: NADH:ubiquinone reductase (Na(+)-transporting) subunit A, partial [Bacteroidota bacterium]